MKSSNNYRIALVGCGRISKNHFQAIHRTEGLELVGVCDVDEERAHAAGTQWEVPAFLDLQQMLDGVDCDVVAVATPSGLHPEHGIQAARAGCHVVCEKPMAVNLESADRLLDECEEAGVQLFVVKQNRLNATVQLLKSAIDKGRFGRIFLINSTVRWTRPQEYYDMAPWRGTWALDGGAIMNQASHYVDLMLWLGGPVESVTAQTATLARSIEAEDTGAAVLRYENGAMGVLEVTMLTFPRNLEGSISVLGEHGTVKIGGKALNAIQHWEFAEYDDDDRMVEAAASEPPSVYGFGHEPYYRNVVAVLRGNAVAGTDGREGRKSLELIRGIYRSAETGKGITFPLS